MRAWTDELVRDAAAYERPGDPEWVSGACMLVRRDAFEAVGGFDEGFFLYCEDTDLCRRLWKAGHRVRFEPAAEVHHVEGASSGAGETRPIAARSRVLYARKHFGPRRRVSRRSVSYSARPLTPSRQSRDPLRGAATLPPCGPRWRVPLTRPPCRWSLGLSTYGRPVEVGCVEGVAHETSPLGRNVGTPTAGPTVGDVGPAPRVDYGVRPTTRRGLPPADCLRATLHDPLPPLGPAMRELARDRTQAYPCEQRTRSYNEPTPSVSPALASPGDRRSAGRLLRPGDYGGEPEQGECHERNLNKRERVKRKHADGEGCQ